MREIGQGLYGFLFAHAVRVDAQDNIWIVDEGSNQVIKFDPDGRVLMMLGRKPEADHRSACRRQQARPHRAGGRAAVGPAPAAPAISSAGRATSPGTPTATSSSPTATAPTRAIAKFDKNGRFLLSWGSRGSEPGQFNTPHSIAIDAQGNVYVADRGNKRIQVFDNDGTRQVADHQRRRADGDLHLARVASVPLQLAHRRRIRDGRRGDLQAGARRPRRRQIRAAGKQLKEFGLVNAIDCRPTNTCTSASWPTGACRN